MSTATSIGPDTDQGGNEDHGNADGRGNKTLGDHAAQQPPAGAEVPDQAGDAVPGKPPQDQDR